MHDSAHSGSVSSGARWGKVTRGWAPTHSLGLRARSTPARWEGSMRAFVRGGRASPGTRVGLDGGPGTQQEQEPESSDRRRSHDAERALHPVRRPPNATLWKVSSVGALLAA